MSFTQGMGAIGRDHMKPQLHRGGQLEFLHLSTETQQSTQSMKFHRRFHCKRGELEKAMQRTKWFCSPIDLPAMVLKCVSF